MDVLAVSMMSRLNGKMACIKDSRNGFSLAWGCLVPRIVLLLAAFQVKAATSEWEVSEVCAVLRPPQPEGLSGITHVEGSQYYAVDDSGGCLYPLTIDIDPDSGAITFNTNNVAVALSGTDLEGVSYDRTRSAVLVCDEADATITIFSLAGAHLGKVDVPTNLKAFRPNYGLESLTMRDDGLELWTCNEEALQNIPLGVDDGPLSTTTIGSVVRLTRFTRSDVCAVWALDGQWAYRTDSIGGRPYEGKERSGVVDLCALPDGTLLVLERELSRKGRLPSFRVRLYIIDFNGASNVADIPSLVQSVYTKVSKKLLWTQNTLVFNYEGICLGPTLNDGSRVLVLISDGDAPTVGGLYVLKLKKSFKPPIADSSAYHAP